MCTRSAGKEGGGEERRRTTRTKKRRRKKAKVEKVEREAGREGGEGRGSAASVFRVDGVTVDRNPGGRGCNFISH